MRQGFRLHRYGLIWYESTTFSSFTAFADPTALVGRPYDQIYLAVSPRQLHTIVGHLVRLDPRALFVLMHPDERPYLAQRLDPVRIVTGILPLVAYTAPLPPEKIVHARRTTGTFGDFFG